MYKFRKSAESLSIVLLINFSTCIDRTKFIENATSIKKLKVFPDNAHLKAEYNSTRLTVTIDNGTYDVSINKIMEYCVSVLHIKIVRATIITQSRDKVDIENDNGSTYSIPHISLNSFKLFPNIVPEVKTFVEDCVNLMAVNEVLSTLSKFPHLNIFNKGDVFTLPKNISNDKLLDIGKYLDEDNY